MTDQPITVTEALRALEREIASAGKAYHHTEDWTDEYVGRIQYAAEQASAALASAESDRAALASERKLRRELQGTLEALRLACSLVPAMNHRDYDPLGARVNKTLARAAEHDAETKEKK